MHYRILHMTTLVALGAVIGVLNACTAHSVLCRTQRHADTLPVCTVSTTTVAECEEHLITPSCDVCILQVPDALPLSGLSTQLSMAQPLMQSGALQDLQALGPDAKLSIFDDALDRPDVSPAGVLAKVATAAKGWQKFKKADSQPVAEQLAASDGSTGQGVVRYTTEEASSSARDRQPGHADGETEPLSIAAMAVSSPLGSAGNSNAAVRPALASASHAAVLQPVVCSSNAGSHADSRQPHHRVGFVESVERSSAGAAEAGAAALHAVAEEEQGQQIDHQASAADLRARMAAGMRRWQPAFTSPPHAVVMHHSLCTALLEVILYCSLSAARLQS